MMIREMLKVSLPPNSDLTAEMDDNNSILTITMITDNNNK